MQWFAFWLYIPLCLYFNYLKATYKSWGIYLYIPLCLYFNGASVRGNVSQSQLYIPLCLYFNVRRPSFSSAENSFTFHYVSILMNWRSNVKIKAVYFTFHYVSILIGNCSRICLPKKLYIPLCLYFNLPHWPESSYSFATLHSIMSLF